MNKSIICTFGTFAHTPDKQLHMNTTSAAWPLPLSHIQWVVSENIHTPPMHEGFLNCTLHPSRNTILVSYFCLQNWDSEIPLPFGISFNLPGVGMDIFWNYTMLKLSSPGFSPEFQHFIHHIGRGKQQWIFKRIAAVFQASVVKRR